MNNKTSCKNCLLKGSKSCEYYRENRGCILKHDLSGKTVTEKRRAINQRIKIEKEFEIFVGRSVELDAENIYDIMDFNDEVYKLRGRIKRNIGTDINIHGGLRYGAVFFTLPEYYNDPILKEDGFLMSSLT